MLDTRAIDETHDWRNFADSDQDNARASLVDPYSNGSLTTRVVAGNSKASQKMAWEHNKYNLDTKTKNVQSAREAIAGLSNSLNLPPQVQSKALDLYRQYEDKRVASQRKATHRPLMVAIVYIACKQEGFGRTFKELAKLTSVPEKEIRSFYKSVDKLLPNTSSPPLEPSSLVERFCSRLSDALPEWVKIGASNIARNASALLEGRQPATIAAASVMLACSLVGIAMYPDAIAAATKTISGSTVQGAFTTLSQYTSQAVPPEFYNKILQMTGISAPKMAASSSATSSSSSSAPSTNATPKPVTAPPSSFTPSFVTPSIPIQKPTLASASASSTTISFSSATNGTTTNTAAPATPISAATSSRLAAQPPSGIPSSNAPVTSHLR